MEAARRRSKRGANQTSRGGSAIFLWVEEGVLGGHDG